MDKFDPDILDQIGKMMGKDKNTMNQVKKMMNNPEAVKQIKKMMNNTMGPQVTTDIKSDSKSKEKIGRNDPCPCDSGKKYKKCCSDI